LKLSFQRHYDQFPKALRSQVIKTVQAAVNKHKNSLLIEYRQLLTKYKALFLPMEAGAFSSVFRAKTLQVQPDHFRLGKEVLTHPRDVT